MARRRLIYVPMSREEIDALYRLAERERRDPRDQAAVLIAQALRRQRPAPEAPKERSQ